VSSSWPAPGDLLRRSGLQARKSYGQNFLTDRTILDRIAGAAGLSTGDRVLEIGPGPGGLTTCLLARGLDVLALELDPRMVEHLADAFGSDAPLEVRLADAAGADLDVALVDHRPAAVVGNLPYHVATAILFRLLEQPEGPPSRMVFMFQWEVAQRLVSHGGDRVCGVPTVAVGLQCSTRLLMRLPPGAFIPPPRVDSAVVVLDRRPEPLGTPGQRQAAMVLARAAFGQRRKMMRASLQGICESPAALLERAGFAPTVRPEELVLEDWVRLAAFFEGS
jgi:16S rRNA (adenine1518-N6/adenine1519-N6)-dimethyltransferase